MRRCLLTCSFTLFKIYTYLEQIYKNNFEKCLHYYINNDLDINLPFQDCNQEESYIHTLVTKENQVLATMNTSSTFDVCNYTLLNITVIFNNNDYQIELKNTLWNFYCVDNKIDYKFLHWYMTNVHHVHDFDDSYICNILNNNYEFIELNKDSFVKLEKDSILKLDVN
tara:strand:+ start:7882 stop:8385 length:504 start_codon:yes stop_codon:yes gene_type:complete